MFLHTWCQYSLAPQYTPLNLIKSHNWFLVFFYSSEYGYILVGSEMIVYSSYVTPIVKVGILHVLQSGMSLESTSLSANGGILDKKDARVD